MPREKFSLIVQGGVMIPRSGRPVLSLTKGCDVDAVVVSALNFLANGCPEVKVLATEDYMHCSPLGDSKIRADRTETQVKGLVQLLRGGVDGPKTHCVVERTIEKPATGIEVRRMLFTVWEDHKDK